MKQTPGPFDGFFKRYRRRRMLKTFLRAAKYVLLFLVILLITGWFVLQNEKVQNYLLTKVTTFLSEKLDTEVTASRIDIDFFDKLVLEGFLIKDHQGDTLLQAGELKATFHTSLIDAFQKKIAVEDIYLNNARLQILRDTGEYETNLDKVLSKLIKKEKKKDSGDGSPLLLTLENVYLQNISFLKDDRVVGQELRASLTSGQVNLNQLNLVSQLLDINTITIDGVQVDLIEKEKHDLLPKVITLDPSLQITQEGVADSILVISPDTVIFKLLIGSLNVKNGGFNFDNYRKSATPNFQPGIMDFSHLNVSDIEVDVEDFELEEGIYYSKINRISAKERSGFELSQLSAHLFKITDRSVELYGMDLLTPYSALKDSLVFKFRSFDDFNDFPNKVLMQARFNNSKVALRDITVFVKNLKNNAFFAQNQDQVVAIDGLVQGRVNSLKGVGVSIKLGKTTLLEGDFSSRNLTKPEEAYLNLNLKRFQSDMATLRLLIPGFIPPRNFDKLGRLDFNGSFLGFFIDFVANGNLTTDLGRAGLDMRMDLRKGRDLAQYAGGISLLDFDLGGWTGNPEFGLVTFKAKVEKGQGLLADLVEANLGATIESMSFKGYQYENIILDGELKQRYFDGKLSIDDPNIEFTFDGAIDFRDSIPLFDFKSSINRLDIKTLNLSDQDLVISGDADIQLIDKNISNIQGDILVKNFQIVKNGIDSFYVDSLLVNSQLYANDIRQFNVSSELLDLKLNGIYNIQEVPIALLRYVESNYPEIATRFGINTSDNPVKDSRFNFDLNIRNTQNWTKIFDPKLDTLNNILANGYFDNIRDSIYLELSIPLIRYDDMAFSDILLDIEGRRRFSDIHFEVYHSLVKGQHFEPIELTSELSGDTLFFEVISTNFTNVFDDLKLNGQLFPIPDNNFQVSFFPSNLVIVKEQWDIAANNYIQFGKNFIQTNNFDLRSGEKRIIVSSIDNKGLRLGLENLNLGLIDDWWDFDQMDFSNSIDIELTADDIFQQKGFRLNAVADTLEINGDDWGQLQLNASLEDLMAQTNIYLSITKASEQLLVKGHLAPFKKEGRTFTDDFSFTASINDYPLSIAEYFVGNIISQTLGKFDCRLNLDGKFNKPNIGGTVRIYDASLRVNYLNTTYRIPESTTRVSNQIFDVSGNYLLDSLGNRAILSGGFTHDHLRNFGLDASLKSDKFLFLNTKKKDNPIYYGTGIGSGNVRFSGPFKQIDIDIIARTGPGTKVVIPVTSANKSGEVKFIEYINEKDTLQGVQKLAELRGVAVNMNIDMTEDADAMLVFDEQAGDIIQGKGNGNIHFAVTRLGDISMYGTYEVVEGDYLFTLLNLVNKPFVVKEGGTIRWEGDPYNAIINIEAEYKGLNTSLTNFISEYLDPVSPGDLEREARKSHNVLLTMYLNGPLKQPDINFDIQFPTLQGQLQNVADSKLRIVRQDQAELNRQVFGLLVIGGFLPSTNNSSLAGRGDLIPINTISELLSNQLSIYLTTLLSEVFTDVGFISGVDFTVNYNVYDSDQISLGGQNFRTTGSALQLRQSIDLFEDRLSVQLGGNIDWGGNVTGTNPGGAFLAGDVVLEYAITKDRRFKVRAYQLTDATILGRRSQRGLGISWRREFDSIGEFFKQMKKDAETNLKDQRGEN